LTNHRISSDPISPAVPAWTSQVRKIHRTRYSRIIDHGSPLLATYSRADSSRIKARRFAFVYRGNQYQLCWKTLYHVSPPMPNAVPARLPRPRLRYGERLARDGDRADTLAGARVAGDGVIGLAVAYRAAGQAETAERTIENSAGRLFCREF
jgi:hypothetical protein